MSEVHTSFVCPTNLGACCDADSSRYALGNVLIERTGETTANAIATNGRIMAIVPVKGEFTLDSVQVPGSACKPLTQIVGNRKWEERKLKKLRGDRTEVKSVKLHEQVDAGRFPDWKQVIPDHSKRVVYKMTINTELLHKLAQAIGCTNEEGSGKYATLSFVVDGENFVDGLIRVDGLNPDDGYGIIMPCSK